MLFLVGTFSGMLSTILLHRASALHGNMCLAALSGQRQLYRSTSFIFEFSSFRSYAFQPTDLEILLSIPVVQKNCTCSFLSSKIKLHLQFSVVNFGVCAFYEGKRMFGVVKKKTATKNCTRSFLSSISVVNFCRQFLSSISVVNSCRQI